MAKTLKFINTDKQQFMATVRKNVNDYFKEKGISPKGGWKIILKTIIMITIYLAPFIIMLTVNMSAWFMLPLIILMGIGMAGIGMSVMHEGVHGSSSSKSWVNKLLGGSMYTLGSNVFNWKIQHNILHHSFTNIDGYDEDIQSRVIIRLSKHAPLWKIHRFQYIYAFFLYSLLTINRMVGDFKLFWAYNKAGFAKQHQVKPAIEYMYMIAAKAIYLFITIGLPLLLTNLAWWQVLLGFFIMHLVAGAIMSTVFQMAHQVEGLVQPLPNSDGNIENEWATHQMYTTANFSRNNRFLSWFVGGLNFQIEHHLFPNINHIHYRNISVIVEKTAYDFGLPYIKNASFRQAFVSHVRTLKALGRK